MSHKYKTNFCKEISGKSLKEIAGPYLPEANNTESLTFPIRFNIEALMKDSNLRAVADSYLDILEDYFKQQVKKIYKSYEAEKLTKAQAENALKLLVEPQEALKNLRDMKLDVWALILIALKAAELNFGKARELIIHLPISYNSDSTITLDLTAGEGMAWKR